MSTITGSIGTLKVIVDTISRQRDVVADTKVTLTQEMVDATERELQGGREVIAHGRLDGVSIGFKVLP